MQMCRKENLLHEKDDRYDCLAHRAFIYGRIRCGKRSIQTKGTFVVVKQDRQRGQGYRRGKKNGENEVYLMAIGYNIIKYCNQKSRKDVLKTASGPPYVPIMH